MQLSKNLATSYKNCTTFSKYLLYVYILYVGLNLCNISGKGSNSLSPSLPLSLSPSLSLLLSLLPLSFFPSLPSPFTAILALSSPPSISPLLSLVPLFSHSPLVNLHALFVLKCWAIFEKLLLLFSCVLSNTVLFLDVLFLLCL